MYSKGMSKESDSLQYGLRVHLQDGDFHQNDGDERHQDGSHGDDDDDGHGDD